jgi:hypothetical protein
MRERCVKYIITAGSLPDAASEDFGLEEIHDANCNQEPTDNRGGRDRYLTSVNCNGRVFIK